MSEPWSNHDSTYSTLPTTPPTPTTTSPRNQLRPSQVAEFIEKVNTKLRRIFGSRRASAEDEAPPNGPSDTRSSIYHALNDPFNFQTTHEELAWNGAAILPNATLQAQRRTSIQADLNRDMYYEADTDFYELHKLRRCTAQSPDRPGKQKRKDSQFSFSDLWAKSRRSSKVDKGKERQLSEGEATSCSQNQSPLPCMAEHTAESGVLPLTDIGILPRTSSDGTSLVPKSSDNIPQAELSSSKSSIASLKFSASASPRAKHAKAAPAVSAAARRASIRLVTPPPGRPDVRPSSSNGSSPSSTSLSSIASSSSFSAAQASPTLRLCRPTDSNPNTNTRRPSLPIAIPRRSSSSHYHADASISITDLNKNPSSTDLSRHGDRPTDTAPPSPQLAPTVISSPTAIQRLSLGPPQRPFLAHEDSSEMFHVSIEGLVPRSPPDPMPSSSLSFEHGAEPQTQVDTSPSTATAMGSSSSVRRRTGGLGASENLREVFVEHGDGDAEAWSGGGREKRGRKSARKSVGDMCWWSSQDSLLSERCHV
ncbi:hypothetical protein BDW02DRAFT_649177 [Decorospora gaudefroyi]|uniref:Uncharacterized protein n=1 Tax=Decorospora gaudefroyi TaxID=184978 RepID=A0A6A5KD61_9PLEO|nr:hypothetical protein BDW02DRAFT_649177 [Decorospora gaudefroyi]